MEPVELGHARGRLETLARRFRDLLAVSAAFALAGAVAAARGHSQLSFSLAFGTAVGLAFAYLARSERSQLLTRLVAQGDEALFYEAKAYARKLSAPSMSTRGSGPTACSTYARSSCVWLPASATWVWGSHLRLRPSVGGCFASR